MLRRGPVLSKGGSVRLIRPIRGPFLSEGKMSAAHRVSDPQLTVFAASTYTSGARFNRLGGRSPRARFVFR